jgi:hypothetical protein
MSDWNPSKYQMIMIPAEVLKVLGEKCKPHLIATYVGIASYYGSKNKKMTRPFPSHNRLGKRIGKSGEAAKKNLYELSTFIDSTGLHLLEIINRKNPSNNKVNTSNEYILPHYELLYLKGLQDQTPSKEIPYPPVADDQTPGYSDTQYLNTLPKSKLSISTHQNSDAELWNALLGNDRTKKALE